MVFLEDSVLLNLVAGETQNYGVTHKFLMLVDKKLSENLIDSYMISCRVCGGVTHYLSLGLFLLQIISMIKKFTKWTVSLT